MLLFNIYFWGALLGGLWGLRSTSQGLTGPLAVRVQSPNCWTAREFPINTAVVTFFWQYFFVLRVLFCSIYFCEKNNL